MVKNSFMHFDNILIDLEGQIMDNFWINIEISGHSVASRTLHLPLSISDIDVGRQPSQITFLPCCKHAWCSALLLLQVFSTIDSGSHYSKKFLLKWVKLFWKLLDFYLWVKAVSGIKLPLLYHLVPLTSKFNATV